MPSSMRPAQNHRGQRHLTVVSNPVDTPVQRSPSPFPFHDNFSFSDSSQSRSTTYQNSSVSVNGSPAPQRFQRTSLSYVSVPDEIRFYITFGGDDAEAARARQAYLKSFIWGIVLILVVLFTIFPIFWGSLWQLPGQSLQGIVVDLDGGVVGLNVTLDVLARSSRFVQWSYAPSIDFLGGPESVAHVILDEQAWVAIVINAGASKNLNAALLNPISSYDGSSAITVYAVEGRQETTFRNFIRPQTIEVLDAVISNFAIQLAQQIATDTNIGEILSISPQTIVQPIQYTINNLRPFHQPVATAATFVGLIYLLILSFFVVMVGNKARKSSGLDKKLFLKSLIQLRIVSSFAAYFVVSLCFSLLNIAFHLNTSETYGRAGFMVLWMLNWVGMLSVGLVLESLVTILTARYIPFFMILWIIVNNTVCMNAIEILPRVYRYGYAIPFYNISRAVRTISLGTKNDVALNFGVLIVWIILSCISMPLLQWYVRRRNEARNLPWGQSSGVLNGEGGKS